MARQPRRPKPPTAADLEKAIKAGAQAVFEICTPTELRRRLLETGRVKKITVQAVHKWKAAGAIPSGQVLNVEAALQGAVSRHKIRPDFYPKGA